MPELYKLCHDPIVLLVEIGAALTSVAVEYAPEI
jgi:hypothetical protein